MTTTFVHDGEALDHIPASKVTAGDVLELGGLLTVAKKTTPAGALGAFHVSGVFDFPKTTGAGTGAAAGGAVFWDTIAKKATAIASASTKLLGYAIRLTADADTTVRVKLMQSGGMIAAVTAAAEGLMATLAAGNTTGANVIDVDSTGAIHTRDGGGTDVVFGRKTFVGGFRPGFAWRTLVGIDSLGFYQAGAERILFQAGSIHTDGDIRAKTNNQSLNIMIPTSFALGRVYLSANITGQIEVNRDGKTHIRYNAADDASTVVDAKINVDVKSDGGSPPVGTRNRSRDTSLRLYKSINFTGGVTRENSGTMFRIHQEIVGALIDTGAFCKFQEGTVAAPTTVFEITRNGNMGLRLSDYGSGDGAIVAIANATTAPTTNPTGGGVIYAEAGALKYRGSSGTVTTLGPA